MIYDLEPGEQAWMVLHNDNSDHGERRAMFDTEREALEYAKRVREAGPQGDYFHPAPESLNLRVFKIARVPHGSDWAGEHG